MKVEYLNPFVLATITTCRSMMGLEVERGALQLKKNDTTSADITSIIGLSGKVKGSIVMSFEVAVAQALIGRFLGTKGDISTEELCDGIGELCNVVGGSAKVGLNNDAGLNLSISIPNVIMGKGLKISTLQGYPSLIVPFSSEVGHFAIEVCLVAA